MQISKINSASTNFKGLWTIKQEKRIGTVGGCSPLYMRDVVYHPFADEKPEDVKKIIAQATFKDNIKTICDTEEGESGIPSKCIVLDPELGEAFGITSSEFEAMKKNAKTYMSQGWRL